MHAQIPKLGDSLLLALGEATARTFLDGLSDSEIDGIMEDYSFVLSPELRALYRWKNGQQSEDDRDLKLVFGIYVFLPLQYALEMRQESLEEGDDWNENWFPFLSDCAGDYYFCDCRVATEESAVYHYFLHSEGDCSKLVFPSLEVMLTTILRYPSLRN